MIEKQKIIDKVSTVVEQNKLDKYFLPIIEEFFCRAVDQYNWNEENFNKYINRFDNVCSIQWHNFWERKLLGIPFKTNKKGEAITSIKNKKSEILLDVDYLKGILSFSEDLIEDFINTSMHEIGHTIQTRVKNSYIYGDDKGEDKNTYYSGFRTVITDAENNIILSNTGTMTNEYAEIINASRLQNGNISKKPYIAYERMQNAGKIMLSSLGITEIEYSNLQLEDKSEFEQFASSKLGKVPAKMYIDSFEEIMDSIWNFGDQKSQRENLIAQIDALQQISEELFEERFENINLSSDKGLRKMAGLIIDKGERDSAIQNLFKEYKIKTKELQIEESKDIYEKITQLDIYEDNLTFDLGAAEEQERERRQTIIDKQNEKKYDNKQLREVIYQSFLRYPIKNVPLKDRPSVMLSKVIGKIKRIKLNKDANLLGNGKQYSSETHREFVNRIANLDEYDIQTANYINNTKAKEIGVRNNENTR